MRSLGDSVWNLSLSGPSKTAAARGRWQIGYLAQIYTGALGGNPWAILGTTSPPTSGASTSSTRRADSAEDACPETRSPRWCAASATCLPCSPTPTTRPRCPRGSCSPHL